MRWHFTECIPSHQGLGVVVTHHHALTIYIALSFSYFHHYSGINTLQDSAGLLLYSTTSQFLFESAS